MINKKQEKLEPKYKSLDKVKIDDRISEGHCRTPAYIRGKSGIIERYCGNFPNPEHIAHQLPNPALVPLYRCRFYQKDIWPNYSGEESDTLELEIYEHWMVN